MSSPIYEYAATLWREMRAEFQDVLEAAYAKAEEGAHGKMLNAEGRREGIDAFSLLTGPWSRVEKYASPELIEWFETEGRPSLDRFEREWMNSWLGEEPLPLAECSDLANHSQPCRCATSSSPKWADGSGITLNLANLVPGTPEYVEAARRFEEARRTEPMTWQHEADC